MSWRIPSYFVVSFALVFLMSGNHQTLSVVPWHAEVQAFAGNSPCCQPRTARARRAYASVLSGASGFGRDNSRVVIRRGPWLVTQAEAI